MYRFIFILLTLFLFVNCGGSSSNSSSVVETFSITSSSFQHGSAISTSFAGSGDNTSLQVAIENTKNAIKSFALILDDPDALPIAGKTFVHWNVFDISESTSSISQGASGTSSMPVGSIEGKNDTDSTGYYGPNPPPSQGKHTYYLTVYGLSEVSLSVDTSKSYTRAEFENLYGSRIVDKSTLTFTFEQ